ncbi:MAG: acetyl-CoA carboxylase biotin carboxyl carrier protein [Bacilli bacterium]|nr:acetyl-CoA carboxylase biotin carboxyl carrier protein [Bacilli bacterium]
MKFKMEYDNIKKLIDDMGNSQLTSLEIDFPSGMKIRMRKDNLEIHEKVATTKDVLVSENNEDFVVENNCIKPLESAEKTELEPTIENAHEEEYKYIKSPMVGTFYSKPSPNEKGFVEVGQRVKKGDTTCIIEAMKLMNEIEAEFDGEVVEILKEDGTPVEFGENLIKLK